MNVAIDGKEHEVHKPVLSRELKVRKLWKEIVELMAGDAIDPEAIGEKWGQVCAVVFVNPSAVLSGELTTGEMAGVIGDFLRSASEIPKNSPKG